jgi:hypothetical protein
MPDLPGGLGCPMEEGVNPRDWIRPSARLGDARPWRGSSPGRRSVGGASCPTSGEAVAQIPESPGSVMHPVVCEQDAC